MFTLENRNLSYIINNNDEISKLLFLTVCDSIGKFYDLNNNEVFNYLSSIDLQTTTVEGITSNKLSEEALQLTINIDTKINTTNLSSIYIELDDLKEVEDFLTGSGSITIKRGNLELYKDGDDKTTTILIAEENNLSDLTYNSILSVIELLYPNDLENFKTSYSKLETISFDRYTITINPELTGTLETLYGQYQDKLKFVEIQINKSL